MKFSEALVKVAVAQQAVPGKVEKYLPWYGAAGLGMAGHELGKLAPKKYQMLGRIGGTLLGTGLGVHGGEAAGRLLDKPKTAAEVQKKSPVSEIAKTLGLATLGGATGMAAGYGAGHLVDYAMKKTTGQGVPTGKLRAVAPLLGLGTGTAYALLEHAKQKKIRNALESARSKTS
jgi:hypothetical protein